jgi:hypothetical protein
MSFDQTILSEFTSFINKSAAAMLNSASPASPAPANEVSSLQHPQVLVGAGLPRETQAPQPVNNSTSADVQNPSEGPGGGGPKPITPPGQALSMSGSFTKK